MHRTSSRTLRFIKKYADIDNIDTVNRTKLRWLIRYLVDHGLCSQTFMEARFMCQLVTNLPDGGKILEIGRKNGGSMVLMCRANPKIKVYSVDLNDKLNSVVKRLAKRCKVNSKQYTLINHPSNKVRWRKPIDLLFLDGDHSYKGVYKDLCHFGHRVTGSILLHDTNQRGVGKAIERFSRKNEEFVLHAAADSMSLLVRREPL